VTFTKGLSCFDEKTLAFQILFAERAIETLTMIVVIKCLYPTISSFDRESTGNTFCCKEFIPIFFAIR
jgi:hypothetical protein